ncbi:FUSC family protein [Quadrisphaera sp. KR29]|uniref:FUSC family protein n=1 Tax=Quadrisphaera sp. KR29 TaxID=3461391 RepID=UPI0040442970
MHVDVAAVTRTARLVLAGVLAYLLTTWLTDGPVDLTGALTALLVLQASAHASLRMAAVRVGAVLTGVLVAVVLSTLVGLTWWSLGLAIAASLGLAALLRLGAQTLETPISAMLVLAVGGQQLAAETRVVTTLIGTGVGIALALLLPPAVPTRRAVAEVREVAEQQAACLELASRSLAERAVTQAEVAQWLGRARAVATTAAAAAEAVSEVGDLRRWNARALGTREVEPALRTGLDALDQSALALRALFVAVHHEAPRAPTPDDGYGEDVRPAFAVLLEEVASCLRAFGELVAAETEGAEADVARQLAEGLERAREARALLAELLFVDARAQTSLWLLRGTLLTAVEQVLVPLDLEERAREREQHTGPVPATAVVAPLVRRTLAQQRRGPWPATWRRAWPAWRRRAAALRRLAGPARRGRGDRRG